MNIKTALDNYLGKSVRYSQEDNGDGTKQVCDWIQVIVTQ